MKATFTNKEHAEHYRRAGCKHPAVYRDPSSRRTVQGWCALCRSVAFGGQKASELH